MGSTRSRIAFVAVIGLALLVIAVAQFMPGDDSSEDSNNQNPNTPEVKGYIGSEKNHFLNNAAVQERLAEEYDLTIDFRRVGSIEQVTEDSTGQDFLWPSSRVAYELYLENHPGGAKSLTVFNSPIVIYSWADVTDTLIDAGLVSYDATNDVYYADMPQFVTLLFEDGTWADVGMPEFLGKVNIISTDPTRSNSGNLFYGLLANLLLGEGEVATDQTIEDVLPDLKAYYDRQGNQQSSTGFLFEQFLAKGKGEYPIIVGYENQLIEFLIEKDDPDLRASILERIRIIYPRPTVWAEHTVIALTENGEQFMAALEDEDLQKIAWEEHGFRSGLSGISNDPNVLEGAHLSPAIENIQVLSLPRPTVMARLIEYLSPAPQ